MTPIFYLLETGSNGAKSAIRGNLEVRAHNTKSLFKVF